MQRGLKLQLGGLEDGANNSRNIQTDAPAVVVVQFDTAPPGEHPRLGWEH